MHTYLDSYESILPSSHLTPLANMPTHMLLDVQRSISKVIRSSVHITSDNVTHRVKDFH